MTITYLSRSEWGADPSLGRRGYRVDGASQFRGVVVHHTVFVVDDWDGDGTAIGDLDDVKAFMQRLQTIRPDLGKDVPYSFVVHEGPTASDAYICEGRGLDYTGAHTAGLNSSRLGVAVAGNTSNRPLTPGVINAINLCGSFLKDQGTLYDTLDHSAFKATECAGTSVRENLHLLQPPFRATPINGPEEDEDDMITVVESNTGKAWVCAGGKARPLSDPQAWLAKWGGPVRSADNMSFVVADLYEIVD